MAGASWASVIGGLIFMTTAYLLYHTFADVYQTSILTAGRGPVFFPRIILAAMAVLSLMVTIEGLREKGAEFRPREILAAGGAIVFSGVYILSINSAGFVIPSMIFTFLMPFVLGYRGIWIALAIAILYPLSIWYLFEKVFLIILPSSPWLELF
ncbi:tripartite tricarboxylate transporter TctB family protein [Tateyamaria pelophila]|uniref:tripartite tricarboxylate transporter TctB family protein n=1 Tax=Tateyamaria pelophila TaxID=328415 RepID=UPI001CBEC91D|nr:tripartite tricarboxylate transporter TctB family protein [Tateyamaria pelophila]